MPEEIENPIVIDWYERHIPHFAEAELIRLYGTMYSSVAWLRVSGDSQDIHTYVARRGDQPVTILLCRIEGTRLRVVTESIELNAEETQRFVDFVFNRFKQVSAVMLNAITLDSSLVERPRQQFRFSEDIVVRLPDNEQAYVSTLGSATRKNVKRHINRLKRDFPSFEFKCMPASEAGEGVMREIIRFNHARMNAKEMVSAIDESQAKVIIGMANECGHVITMRIDGRLCGGAIIYRFGTHFVSRISAHDPAYDDYRLGMSCCFLTVCEAIRMKGEHFHFLWGQYDYKTALLGVQHDQHRTVIYRSPLAVVRHANLALQTARLAARLAAKRWLLEKSKEDSRSARTLRQTIARAKSVRRILQSRKLRSHLEARPANPLAES